MGFVFCVTCVLVCCHFGFGCWLFVWHCVSAYCFTLWLFFLCRLVVLICCYCAYLVVLAACLDCCFVLVGGVFVLFAAFILLVVVVSVLFLTIGLCVCVMMF